MRKILLFISMLFATTLLLACQGPVGEEGPAGKDGRAPTDAELINMVNEALTNRLSEVQGPPGPAGAQGPRVTQAATATTAPQAPLAPPASKASRVCRDPSARRAAQARAGFPAPGGLLDRRDRKASRARPARMATSPSSRPRLTSAASTTT